MKTHLRAFFILILILVAGARAEVITTGSITGGVLGNLFSDSNEVSDSYASFGAELEYYPSGSVQLYAGGIYNTFNKYGDLSNWTGDLSVTIIPTPANSPLILGCDASLSTRKFGLMYELYNQADVAISTDLGYTIRPGIDLQTSFGYTDVSYGNSDFGSNRGVDVSSGLTMTLPGANSLALFVEYSHYEYDQPTIIEELPTLQIDSGQVDKRKFDFSGIRLRFSRQFGERTGFSLSAGHRHLHTEAGFVALGYTIDYLSPWSDLWEGSSVSCDIKHFFPKQVIANLSLGCYDKSYVDVIEYDDGSTDPFWRDSRDDQLSLGSLSLSRPISLKNGGLLTPSLEIGYRHNISTIKFFEYDDYWATLSFKISL